MTEREITFTTEEFTLIRDIIYAESGMFSPFSKQYFLEDRVGRRINGNRVNAIAEYCNMLKNGLNKKEEFQLLFDEVTVNETSFFRDTPVMDTLQKIIFPEIIKEKGEIGFNRLKIWSAACSTGEEPYTMAMILSEMKKTILKGWEIEIIATDISQEVISRAIAGSYKVCYLRNAPEYYKKTYFTRSGTEFLVKDEIKGMVKFSILNLFDEPKVVFMKGFDLILCSNVLIYFDKNSKARVIQHYFNNLLNHGYLFIGQSESLHGVSDAFKVVHFPGCFGYRKDLE